MIKTVSDIMEVLSDYDPRCEIVVRRINCEGNAVACYIPEIILSDGIVILET